MLHGLDVAHLPSPSFEFEDKEERYKLALKWDELGLLRLVDGPSQDGFFTRVFNCYKDVANDRQIGDRRQVNKHECHLGGPSSRLPNGQLLVNLSCKKWKESLRGSVTGRRDFYRQAQVSLERSATNVLHFPFNTLRLRAFEGTTAFMDYVNRYEAERRSGGREAVGDHLGKEKWKRKKALNPDDQTVYVAFGAL